MKRHRILYGFILVFGLFATLIICDPIYRLGVRLSWSQLKLSGFPWDSGLSSLVKGQSSEGADELSRGNFPNDHVLETRYMPIASALSGIELCPAALVEHDQERWIYVFYRRNDRWFMKMFSP